MSSLEHQLARRLTLLGLPGATRVVTHTNRTVMVSLTPEGVLRLHRGYAYAPDRVLAAIVRFLTPYARRSTRHAARRELLAFPVHEFAPSSPATGRRTERPHPEDAATLEALASLHRQFNEMHFANGLGGIPFRLSGRMRSRLGELSMDVRTRLPLEIGISRRHVRRDGWEAVAETVLHEMIHQWQAETGLPVDHGAAFRAKARAIGVEPRARRTGDVVTR